VAQLKNIGFDLDLTLVDSTKAICTTASTVISSFLPDLQISIEEIEATVGLPMEESLGRWVGLEKSTEAYELYKQMYASTGLAMTTEIPGAVSTIKNLLSLGFQVCVITAKDQNIAELQLAHLGFPKLTVFGNCFGHDKTTAMLKFNCLYYIGDHYQDFLAAKAANVKFIGVGSNHKHHLKERLPNEVLVLAELSEINSILQGFLGL